MGARAKIHILNLALKVKTRFDPLAGVLIGFGLLTCSYAMHACTRDSLRAQSMLEKILETNMASASRYQESVGIQ